MPRSSGDCRLCEGIMAAEAARCVRGACRTVPSEPGALRRVSTLYFETDTGDGFRDRGFSKERRKPQVAIGLLTDQAGFPLMVSAFEGNMAETKTMLPVIESLMTAHLLPYVMVVADADIIAEATRRRSRRPGCRSSSACGFRTSPTWSLGGGARTRANRSPTGRHSPSPGRSVIYYQYRHDRARRILRAEPTRVRRSPWDRGSCCAR
jgi:hypothetical protein